MCCACASPASVHADHTHCDMLVLCYVCRCGACWRNWCSPSAQITCSHRERCATLHKSAGWPSGHSDGHGMCHSGWNPGCQTIHLRKDLSRRRPTNHTAAQGICTCVGREIERDWGTRAAEKARGLVSSHTTLLWQTPQIAEHSFSRIASSS